MYKIYYRCSCMQKLSRIVSLCQAAIICASTCINMYTEDYKFKRRAGRIDRAISRNVLEKNRKCDRGISPCHCTVFYASHSMVAAATEHAIRARNSVLEIYLCFDEAQSYPRYFLRKHKSPVGTVVY